MIDSIKAFPRVDLALWLHYWQLLERRWRPEGAAMLCGHESDRGDVDDAAGFVGDCGHTLPRVQFGKYFSLRKALKALYQRLRRRRASSPSASAGTIPSVGSGTEVPVVAVVMPVKLAVALPEILMVR